MDTLPDALNQNLKILFCGTAAGRASALQKTYYAGRGNQFWQTLYTVGLTPRLIKPDEFHMLTDFGIGLTDLAKTVQGNDTDIDINDFDCDSLRKKMLQYKPAVLAFNGKKSANVFLKSPIPEYGKRTERIGETSLFVLPSTSGAARRFWDIGFWRELARFVQTIQET